MQEYNKSRIRLGKRSPDINIMRIIIIWSAVIAVALGIFIILNGDLIRVKNLYLLPWIFATALVIAAPSVYLYFKNEFSLYHPLVFPAWTYFIPAFIGGGLLIAFEISVPYFLYFVKDQQNNLPLTYLIVMIGYGGLSLGYLLPLGRIIGEKVEKKLPNPKWKKENLYIPGLALLSIGVITTTFAYVMGVLGYQQAQEINSYDGLIFLFSIFSVEASFFLWLLLFRRGKVDMFAFLISLAVIIVSLAKSVFAGNRGSLYGMVILIVMAFLLAGRKIRLKQGAIFTVVLFLAIIIGMIYGTTFRNVKQSEARIGIDEYTSMIFETFDMLGRGNNTGTFDKAFDNLGNRLTETGSGLAVVVANYEDLKPYEESYGLDGNIWKDTVTTFIPRIIWEDKPLASDPRRYSELYFDYGLSSFSITPMGDLLRNYGLIGVPLGMLLLGLLLRIIYSSLIENQEFSAWRATLFYMLLTSISYESFYGAIMPFLVKYGVFSVLGLFIIHILVKKPRTPEFVMKTV